jgi:hypothetical protein
VDILAEIKPGYEEILSKCGRAVEGQGTCRLPCRAAGSGGRRADSPAHLHPAPPPNRDALDFLAKLARKYSMR